MDEKDVCPSKERKILLKHKNYSRNKMIRKLIQKKISFTLLLFFHGNLIGVASIWNAINDLFCVCPVLIFAKFKHKQRMIRQRLSACSLTLWSLFNCRCPNGGVVILNVSDDKLKCAMRSVTKYHKYRITDGFCYCATGWCMCMRACLHACAYKHALDYTRSVCACIVRGATSM